MKIRAYADPGIQIQSFTIIKIRDVSTNYLIIECLVVSNSIT